MKLVRVEEAVGKRLAVDYTIVTPDRKGALKKRGEFVSEEDVELLKANGHYYVYIIDEGEAGIPGEVLETDAARILAESIIAGPLTVEAMDEGKVAIRALGEGLLLVNSEGLDLINSTDVYAVITRRSGSYVRAGSIVGIVDVIPLSIPENVLHEIVSKAKQYAPVLELKPSVNPVVGILIVGSEIVEGLKKDVASSIVKKKLSEYGCRPGRVEYARDNEVEIKEKIESLLSESDAVVAVGGMSVDPTDRTHIAIRMVADEVVKYGIPMKPTTMSMVAYKNDKPIIGVSSGIIYFQEFNFLDIILPWVSSNTRIPREYLVRLGNGGLSDYFLRKIR
ncbi:molybdopterin-binding protein [Thermogladius sp. 4427co]|uniref:molybdopterin-binding protein n=1 Tax=Thermogladius sp. 4427co TaxID=3450718 RepID=UPI003F7AF417